MRYLFADYVLDTDRRELRRGAGLVAITPQAFDLLDFLIRQRHRVVSRDDLFAAIWHRRIVSDSALTTRINAARTAIGDSARQPTLPRDRKAAPPP
jgi:DNA-binding winged helix-turn-helix (wHTH) protein